ncbi:hypothetical protein J2X97_003726 [Epilithonimonas hungarica]|uniref:Imm32 family immunity protein n=1 Tax=Epilithonimonas hungarica TaxID=454006 RepID=UPI00277E5628|nr:hypothetical protein [Epilithonimonas hungarica]MDP9958052.1 hypothetical protein [Epilithonimonas hungarica]
MEYNLLKGNEIDGHLDVFIAQNDDKKEVLIHGNQEGLKSLAKLLLKIADLNQEEVEDKYLPTGARKHYHLRPNIELSNSSDEVIVGRLDAKGTGEFYSRFKAKTEK